MRSIFFPLDHQVHISALLVFSGDLHMCIICKGLPVALLKNGSELLPGAHLEGMRELLSLHPLVDLVQSLLPLHGRHQLLHQLPAHVFLGHVAFAVHVGVHFDLRDTDLTGREI